jgi:hypothetical protein
MRCGTVAAKDLDPSDLRASRYLPPPPVEPEARRAWAKARGGAETPMEFAGWWLAHENLDALILLLKHPEAVRILKRVHRERGGGHGR